MERVDQEKSKPPNPSQPSTWEVKGCAYYRHCFGTADIPNFDSCDNLCEKHVGSGKNAKISESLIWISGVHIMIGGKSSPIEGQIFIAHV